jgi:hypothetical protein
MVVDMAEYMRNYRETHPEYKERENEKLKLKLRSRYNDDPEYREKKKKLALENYYKKKQIV